MSCPVPTQFCNIKVNFISSEEALISRHNTTLYWTNPDGDCSQSCKLNQIYSHSPYNQPPRNTSHCTAMNILFFSGFGNVISPRAVGTTLWELGIDHKTKITHRFGKRDKNTFIDLVDIEFCTNAYLCSGETTAEVSISMEIYILKIYKQMASKRRPQDSGAYVVYDFLLFFWHCDMPVALKHRLYNERWNDVDVPALEVITCSHLVYESCFMSSNLG